MDGGKTWSAVDVGPVEVVDEVPPHASVRPGFDVQAPARLYMRIIRRDGTSAVVVPADDRLDGLAALPFVQWRCRGGRQLVGTTVSRSDAGPTLVSRDRGRTWQEVSVPAELAGRQIVVRPTDGRTIYVLDAAAYRLWRSSDGGTHWHELALPFGAGDDDDTGFVHLGLPDGGLVVGDPQAPFAYFAIGATDSAFEPVDHESVRRLAARASETAMLTFDRASLALLRPDGSLAGIPFSCLGSCQINLGAARLVVNGSARHEQVT